MKHNPMVLNKGLCSLEKLLHKIKSWKETQEIMWSFSRIAIYRTQHLGCILGTNLR